MKLFFTDLSRLIGRIVTAVLMISLLTSCTSLSGPQLHSFQFDAIADSSDILILAFKYGDLRASQAGEDEAFAAKSGMAHVRQGSGIGGFMPRGDFLFVKWRIKSTGQILEDRVDLRDRLPADITHHTIYFVVQKDELVVYLISPEFRAPSDPRTGPTVHKYHKSTIIYPDRLRSPKR